MDSVLLVIVVANCLSHSKEIRRLVLVDCQDCRGRAG